MAVCPRCSNEVAGAKFCPECGTPLGTVQNERRERRVVSVMFADLVGFTKRSKRSTSKMSSSLLAPYIEVVSNEVMQTGGVVAKYTGDGAMAMFGGDVAHEDDAERAVRSALGICEQIAEFGELALHVRIGVATGEVLVTWGSDGKIDGVGDTVNTASRLESSAPDDRVLVDAATQRATASTILYEPAGEIEVKGKSEPLETWLALEPRSIVPEQPRRNDVPLVGRGAQVEMLRGSLSRSRREPSTQLLSVIGSPGIGKSRLVEELSTIIEEMPGGLIIWRQGRSLPYGEGAGFWALGEMVKAQAGIRESDSADLAASKLDDAVAALIVAERDREWITRHLRPLVGIDAGARRSSRGCSAGGLQRVAAVVRGDGRRRSHRARVRGHPLGRRWAVGLHRPTRRQGRGGAATDRLHRPAGAARAKADVGRRQGQRGDHLADAARAGGHRPAGGEPARPGPDTRRAAADAAGTVGGQSVVCAGVRAHASGSRAAGEDRWRMGVHRRDRRSARVGAGHHRRAAGHPHRRGEDVDPGRRGDR